MQWYGIVIISASVLVAVYIAISAIAGTKFLTHVCQGKGRTYEISRELMQKQDKWDFEQFDNVWNKQPFEVTTFDGLKLHCLNIVNPNATQINGRKKVVIVCHGHISNLMQSVKYADIFYQMGYNVVLYDNRFFGMSQGDYCTLGQNETKDLATVIDATKQLYGQNCFIALHGESMAGATVLNVLADRQSDIQLVVADCPFADTWQLFKENAHEKAHMPSFPMVNFASFLAKRKYDYDFRSVSPIKVLPNVDVPICFIHGTADKLIYPHHSVDLYQKCKNPLCQLHLFEGAVHARSHMKDSARYVSTVKQFVQTVEDSVVNK